MPVFVNLTPHALNIERPDMPNLIIPASGDVARVETHRVPCGTIGANGIPVELSVLSDVTGLPEPSDGTYYIVSGMVLDRVQHRADVFAPGQLLRDDAGRVSGCRGLSCTEAYADAEVE